MIFVWGSLAVLAGLAIGLMLGRQGAQGAALAEKQAAEALRLELAAQRALEGDLRERAARAEQSAADALKQLTEDQQRLDKLRAEIGAEAGRLLTEKSGELRAEAGRHFEGVMAPLKQNVEDLKAMADRIHKQDSESRAALSEQVRALGEAHKSFSSEAQNLAQTLKGNVKVQGRWGEVVLERVLEAAGLRAGTEYVLQGKGLELKGLEGEAQKPDAVIHLPDGKHLVVDAKASLDGYFAWVEARDDAAREIAAAQQVLALKKQVKDLAEKGYAGNAKLHSPEFTLMFVPMEPALSLALQREPGLFEQAWEKRIVVVGPNTLFSTLKVVAQLWGQERRHANAERIAEVGGKLYDKFVAFLEDLTAATKAQESASSALLDAKRKLVDGPGNIVGRTEELAKLGAKATKRLKEEVVQRAQEGI